MQYDLSITVIKKYYWVLNKFIDYGDFIIKPHYENTDQEEIQLEALGYYGYCIRSIILWSFNFV